jgi:hypothetical protein
MALIGKRRIPIRIPLDRMGEAREWWRVNAPSAEAARKLCLKWPLTVKDGDCEITDHGRVRS